MTTPTRKTLSLLALSAAIFSLSIGAACAQAVTDFRWAGPVGGFYSTVANWEQGDGSGWVAAANVPGGGNTIFAPTANQLMRFDQDVTIEAFDFTTNVGWSVTGIFGVHSVHVTGDFTKAGNQAVTFSDFSVVAPNLELTIDGALNANGAVRLGTGGLNISKVRVSGTTTIDTANGKLEVVSPDAVFGAMVVNQGIYAVYNWSPGSGSAVSGGSTVASLSGGTDGIVAAKTLRDIDVSATLTINGGSGTSTFSGTLVDNAQSATNGTLSILKTGASTQEFAGATTYTGSTTVSAGTLLLSGTASIGSSSVITVASGAVLHTSGVTGGFELQSGQKLMNKGAFVGSLTVLNGSTYAPGNSPGIASQDGDLTLNTGSMFEWELIGNTDAGVGTNFDQTDFVSGGLTIETGVTADLVFDVGSTVDWTDSFWASNQQWLVFKDASSLSNVAGIFTTINVGLDSIGASLGSVRSGAAFGFSSVGNDVFLNYTAVPEPSTWVLLIGAITILITFRRRSQHS